MKRISLIGLVSGLSAQPQKYKVWIAGNHEVGLEKAPEIAYQVAKETNSTYLCDSEVEIEGAKIWGSPVTPEFHSWEFNRQRGFEIRKHWENIPENIDILITHGPPMGHLDDINGEHVGCQDLLDVLNKKLTHPPRYHIFGHIHEGYGRSSIIRDDGKSIALINASSCNPKYYPVNPAITFEL